MKPPRCMNGPFAGRTVLTEHLYWHASNVNGPEWAVDYLDSAACDWTAEEIDFVDWVFNAAPVLKERAAWMALNEGLTGNDHPLGDLGQVLLVPDDFFGLQDIDLQIAVIDAESGSFFLTKRSGMTEVARCEVVTCWRQFSKAITALRG